MTDAFENYGGIVSIGGRTITNHRFADDIDVLAGEEAEPAILVNILTKPPQPTTWRSVPRSHTLQDSDKFQVLWLSYI